MSNVVRQGVEGIGVSQNLPILTENSYFTEVAIPETVVIPPQKPDMEELLSVMVDAKIVSLRIINTPVGTSHEGQTLTGKKLSIELELRQKVKYIANEPTQSVHAAHFDNRVSSIWVVVPPKVTIKGKEVPIETLLMQDKLVVTPYIEDIFGEQLDRRTIFKNITVLIHVSFDTCCEALLSLTKVGNINYGAGNILYTLTIKNDGCLEARNIKLFDAHSVAGKPLGGTVSNFIVDGTTISDPDLINGVDIGNLEPTQTITVTYVFDPDGTVVNSVTNTASAEYEYKLCSSDTKTVSVKYTTP